MNENNMEENISDNLAMTVAETGYLELPAEILEFSIDQVLDEGIMKDIPFVGWIAKGVSIGCSISDRMFHHKILRFLIALERIGEGDRESFRKKIKDDKNFKRKVGEHLLLLIDKIDSFEKASILARCFDHFLTGDIDYDYFVDLSLVIERTPLSDLKALSVPDNKRILFNSIGVAVACGILEFGIAEPETGENLPGLGTKISKHGRDLRDMLLDHFRERLAQEKESRRQFLKQFEKTI